MASRASLLTAMAGLAMALCACATPPLPPPQATLGNIQAVRAGDLAPMAVGAFTPGPGKPTQMDRSISVRADAQPAPPGGYAKYLGDTIAAQLEGAGRLDPASRVVVSGVVTDTHVNSALPMASARLAARITLVRDGATVFDKTVSVEETWASDFMGVVAIPDAFNHYTGLFRALAAKLFADPEFVAAARRR